MVDARRRAHVIRREAHLEPGVARRAGAERQVEGAAVGEGRRVGQRRRARGGHPAEARRVQEGHDGAGAGEGGDAAFDGEARVRHAAHHGVVHHEPLQRRRAAALRRASKASQQHGALVGRRNGRSGRWPVGRHDHRRGGLGGRGGAGGGAERLVLHRLRRLRRGLRRLHRGDGVQRQLKRPVAKVRVGVAAHVDEREVEPDRLDRRGPQRRAVHGAAHPVGGERGERQNKRVDAAPKARGRQIDLPDRLPDARRGVDGELEELAVALDRHAEAGRRVAQPERLLDRRARREATVARRDVAEEAQAARRRDLERR